MVLRNIDFFPLEIARAGQSSVGLERMRFGTDSPAFSSAPLLLTLSLFTQGWFYTRLLVSSSVCFLSGIELSVELLSLMWNFRHPSILPLFLPIPQSWGWFQCRLTGRPRPSTCLQRGINKSSAIAAMCQNFAPPPHISRGYGLQTQLAPHGHAIKSIQIQSIV